MEKRIITTDVTEEDFFSEGNLRPQTLGLYWSGEDQEYLEGLYRGCEAEA